jgi:hypothetical protein
MTAAPATGWPAASRTTPCTVLSCSSPIGSSISAVPPTGTIACCAIGRPRQIAENLSP